jgi:hypothetical protein
LIIVFNRLAVILLLATGLPCFLIFGLGFTAWLERPDLVEVLTGVSICVVAALLDFALRMRTGHSAMFYDARFGAHLFFVPLWAFGLFTAATVVLGAK